MDKKTTDKIVSKLEKIQEDVAEINVTLASQHVTLQEHERRSLANEKAVQTLAEELKPVFTHVYLMKLLGKILVSSSALTLLAKFVSSFYR